MKNTKILIKDEAGAVITFDPNDNPKNYLISVGTKVKVLEDIYYCSQDDFDSTFEDYDLDYLYKDVVKVNEALNEVYIPAGTKMTYLGTSMSGWPTFKIKNEEFDFAGDPFKIEIL